MSESETRAFRLLLLVLGCFTAAAQVSPRPITLNADLLLRAENTWNVQDRENIRRARIWLRPGFEVTPSRWLRLGARGSFAKGSHPNRENILRFDNFHSNDVSLDRVYAAVHRGGIELRAGKFALPFPVSEMLWDRDLQPSGLYAGVHRSGLTLGAAVFHRSHIHHDRSTIAGAQAGFERGPADGWRIDARAGFFAFNALDQFQPGMQRQNRARILDSRVRYEARFQLLESSLRVEHRPVAIESTYIHNFGAADEQRAFEALVEFGKLESRGDWRLRYFFQRVGREAVVGAFTSDDWWYHSGFYGSRITAACRFASHFFVEAGAVFQKRRGAPSVKRVQVDLSATF